MAIDLGCDKLSSLEDDMVLAFMEPGTESDTRLTVVLNKAYKVNVLVHYCVLQANHPHTRWPGKENIPEHWLCSLTRLFGVA